MPSVTMPLPRMNNPAIPATVTFNFREMPALNGPGAGEVATVDVLPVDTGEWSLWQNLEGTFISAPAVAAWGDQQIDLFGISTDSQLYHKRWDGKAWGLWESLEGTCIYTPAAVARGANLVDVFAIGLDKQVYHKWWDGTTWQGWEEVGGTCIHGLAATSWGPDRIDLFSVGTNSCLYHNYWDGEEWQGWRPFVLQDQMAWERSSTTIAAPAAVASTPGRIDLFVLGIDNQIYHAWGDGESWQGWENVGGPGMHGVAVTARGPGNLDLFTIGTDLEGTDNHMYHRAMVNGKWGNWDNLGGACISAPAAVALGEHRLDTFVVGTRSALFQKTWSEEGGLGAQSDDESDEESSDEATGQAPTTDDGWFANFYNRLTYYLGSSSQTAPAPNFDQYNVKPDPTVTEFADNPYWFYAKIIDRRRDQDNNPNFNFYELEGTLDNMLLHIEDIKQRAQFGKADPPDQENFRVQVHASISRQLKQEILQGPTLDKLTKDILALKGRRCPYRDTLLFINKFIKVVDYITFRAKSQPEMESYGLDWKAISPGRGTWQDLCIEVTKHRNQKFSAKGWAFNSAFPFYKEQVTLEDIYNGNYEADDGKKTVNVGGTGIYRFERMRSPDGNKDRFRWLLDNPDIILFPSYEPLNEEFFCKIRCVPIFMLGMLNIEYLNADNDRQSPAVFFEHDCFHVIGFDNFKLQLASLNKRIEDWKAGGYAEGDVYHFWYRNWQSLQQRINSMKSHYLKDAVYKVLFTLVHEPIDGEPSPIAVFEADALKARFTKLTPKNEILLLSELTRRINKGEFGDVDPTVTLWLPHAVLWLKRNIDEVFAREPSKDHI